MRVSTYQSVSGAGAQRMEQLLAEPPAEHDLAMDWTWDGDETDEESKLRAETRKILELPELPISATTVRVPVLVGHAQAVWIEPEEPLSPEQAAAVLAGAPACGSSDCRRRARRRRRTTCSSAGSAPTAPPRTASCSSSRATTS